MLLKQIETTELQPAIETFTKSVKEIAFETPHPKTAAQAYIGYRKP